MKNEILKYLGIIVMLIGVILLAVYHFSDFPGNTLLIIAAICVVVGAVGHVILNKFIE
ncbi:hypothetical protein [Paludibacter sp. 221]|uniref:hypothetical protein n=1 Tax=Paludibacter sp. 221 TaxID=2302939 RepID=UPI0013D7B2A3|nr:hypothetical protein [Paludibacter sp. 221]